MDLRIGAESSGVARQVVVHPLVLLSVVDHYNRVAKDTDRRVVGVLLGETFKGRVDVTNSYAVPFEEDRKDPTVWFLDHNYHEDMHTMFRKVNASEKVVGWYSTGPKIRAADIEVNEMMRRYCPDPVLVVVDVNPKDDLGIPTEAYRSVENSEEERGDSKRTFLHIPSSIGAFEAEEVGVEHLLRDIRDSTVSSLAAQVGGKLNALKGLEKHIAEIEAYVDAVVSGRLSPEQVNHTVIGNLQDMFNLSPNLRVQTFVKAFTAKTNDTQMVVYLSSLVRSIIALHDLINNKIANKEGAQPKAKDATTDNQKASNDTGEKATEAATKK